MENDTLTLCAVYGDAPSAYMARGMLASNDIPSIVDNDIVGTLFPPAGGLRLMVRYCDLMFARDVLSDAGLLE